MGAGGTSEELRGPHEAGGRAQGGGRAPTLMGSPGLFWPNSFTSGASFGPEKIIKIWDVNWTPFGFPFLRY